MLETFTIETFQPHVGQPFRVIVDEKWEMPTVLGEVTAWSEASGKGRPRQPFSLVFYAKPDALIPQAIYRVESAVVDPFDCFLVPLGPDHNGMRYEAVFT